MIVTVSPVGDLDELVLDELQAQLAAIDDDAELVVDFTKVTFCGSGCIRLLIETSKRLKAGRGSLVIRNAQTAVRRAFVVGAVDFLLEPQAAEDDSNSQAD